MKRAFQVFFMSVAAFSTLVTALCLLSGKTPFFLVDDGSVTNYETLPTAEDWKKIDTLVITSSATEIEFLEAAEDGLLSFDPYNAQVQAAQRFDGSTYSLSLKDNSLKRLTVRIPSRTAHFTVYIESPTGSFSFHVGRLKLLQISGFKPSVSIDGLAADSVTLDLTSSLVRVTDSEIGVLKVTNPTGDTTVRAGATDSYFDTYAGKLMFTPLGKIHRCDVRMASGETTLFLAADQGYTVKFKNYSGDLFGDFPFSQEDLTTYTFGDGSSNISIDTDSGDVRIYKQPAAGRPRGGLAEGDEGS